MRRKWSTPTRYGGVLYRSGLEASFAELWRAMGLRSTYEPSRFRILGHRYTPDFLVEKLGWVEVKPTFPDAGELRIVLAFSHLAALLVVVGRPQARETYRVQRGEWSEANVLEVPSP